MGRRFSETIKVRNNGIIRRGLFGCGKVAKTVELTENGYKNCVGNKNISGAYAISLEDVFYCEGNELLWNQWHCRRKSELFSQFGGKLHGNECFQYRSRPEALGFAVRMIVTKIEALVVQQTEGEYQ